MFLARLRRRIFKYHTFCRYAFWVMILGLVAIISALFIFPGVKLIGSVLSGPISVLSLMSPQKITLKQTDGRTNILLLGIGGGNHDGPNMTDSIMVISFKQNSTTSVVLISLPRDIYLENLGDKINSAYDTGKTKKPDGGGILLAKSAVSEITGIPIHYALVIDFSGFEKAINLLGGIDVKIENTFDDYQYPISGKENDLCGMDPGKKEEEYLCRYEHLHLDAGPAHLSGEEALKYVRSRHASGDEGTDFARARRQQIVLEAVKTKILSLNTLLQPQRLNDLFNSFKANLDTDLSRQEMAQLVKIGLSQKGSRISNYVLSQDLFDNPPIDERGWILLPRDGTFEEIRRLIQTKLSEANDTGPNKN